MKLVYVILRDGEHQEVSKEEYDAFAGEKWILPSHWRLMLAAELLLPLRWS